jgi:hypothetical protein
VFLLCVCHPLGLQALLVRTIAGLRRNTASRTDERVRLTGEVIQVRVFAFVVRFSAPAFIFRSCITAACATRPGVSVLPPSSSRTYCCLGQDSGALDIPQLTQLA